MLGLGAAVMTREVDVIEGSGMWHFLTNVVSSPVEAGTLKAGERRQDAGGRA